MTWINGEYSAIQQRADEKKQKLMDTAIRLFGERGFHKTTAKEIAKEAGVATGTFYRYFKDKKAILMAVCHRKEEDMGVAIFDISSKLREQNLSEKEIIHTIIGSAVTSHYEDISFHREIHALQHTDEDVRKWVHEREHNVYKAVLELFKSSRERIIVDDIEAAAELISYIVEEVSHRVLFEDIYTDKDRLIRQLQIMVSSYLLGESTK